MIAVFGFAALVAVYVLTNYLCWRDLARSMPGRRPWSRWVLVGFFAYYPWLDRTHPDIDTQERP